MNREISWDEYRSHSYKKYDIDFNVYKLMKDINHENIAFTDRYTIAIFKDKNGLTYCINKCIDEYYKVHLYSNLKNDKYYLCDQYDGLIDFLNMEDNYV